MATEKRTYNQLKEELDQVLRKLQHEDTDVDAAVELHSKGEKLLKEIEAYLADIADKKGLDIKRLQ